MTYTICFKKYILAFCFFHDFWRFSKSKNPMSGGAVYCAMTPLFGIRLIENKLKSFNNTEEEKSHSKNNKSHS